eukprot:comp15213_c0_seq1/m.11969 comp15213_c0_seq1/g.11969  ORF comp15213_c0_seq1/g.11969 comp15213_c0_seq1/m.11969 type:complete len:191 (-) comp15213_c0_seq1:311-883(-)
MSPFSHLPKRLLLCLFFLGAITPSLSFYLFTANNAQGEPVPLIQYKGKVVLVVNVASFCGFTYQYEALENLYREYKDKGFAVLGFPCNQFGGQEPHGMDKILSFTKEKYDVTFPIFEKIDVNGVNEHPLYTWLKEQKTSFGIHSIKWNFEKFLIDRNGNVVARYDSYSNADSMGPEVDRLVREDVRRVEL